MTSDIPNALTDLIGNTPLVRFSRTISHATVLAKLELYNLTGSVKDRMAYHMLVAARKKGLLRTGGTIIEATTGNTGIAFSALARTFGILVGFSSGANISAIRKIAYTCAARRTFLTIFADRGERYLSI